MTKGEKKPKAAPEAAQEAQASNSLAAAKLAVMRACPYLLKRSSKDLKYTYGAEADFLRLLRPAMIDQSLVMTPVGAEMVATSEFKSKSGTPMTRFVCRMTYRLTHAISGQFEDIVILGEGMDVGDKAVNKSMTDAMKYALRQAFMIETGDDPDRTASETYERSEVQEQRSEDKALQASYEKCLGALASATTVQQIESYRRIYRTRPFEPWMVGNLDDAFLRRRDEMEDAARQPAHQQPQGDGQNQGA